MRNANDMKHKRGTQRTRARGAALVEALVVIPVFVIVFASMVFVGQLYSERQRTMMSSRSIAWSYAMNNCDGDMSGAGGTLASSQGGESVPVPADGADEISKFRAAQGSEIFRKDLGTSVSTVTGAAHASAIIGGYSKSPSTTTRVMCNEKPVDGYLEGVAKFAWQTLTRW